MYARSKARLLVAVFALGAFMCGAVQASIDDSVSDTRLTQRVRVKLKDVPLRSWLGEISKETSILFRTAPSYEDRAITLRVRDMPVGELMQAVAGLYGDRWTPRGKGRDAEYTLEASEDRRRLQAQLTEGFRKSLRTELMELVRDVAKNGPKPWMTEGGDERFSEELQARARILAELTPEAVDQLLAGDSFRIPLAEAKGKVGEALWQFAKQFAMPDASGWKQQDRAAAWVQFTAQPYALPQFALHGVPLQAIHFLYGGRHGRSSNYNVVAHPDHLARRLTTDLLPLLQKQEQDPDERLKRGGARLERTVRESALGLRSGPPISRSELLVALAEETDVDLVCDSHTKAALPRPDLVARTVAECLTRVASLSASFWKAEGRVFTIRSRYWWLDDPAEPPATLAEQWENALAREGRLDLAQAAAIASLSREQRQRLAIRIPESRSAGSPWLRLYGSMNARQRQAAHSAKGMEFWKLDEKQRDLPLQKDTDDPTLGNSGEEGLIRDGAAMLRVVQETPANDTAAPAVVFSLKPVPDVTGKTRFGGNQVRIVLPRRPRRPG